MTSVGKRHRTSRIILAGIAALAVDALQTRAEGPPYAVFINDLTQNTNEGHAALKWSGDGDALVYELQSAMEPDFREPTTEYRGADESSFQSGLVDGRYFYRIRARRHESDAWGPWSEPIEVVCEHHSLALAWTLFASGGILFLLIVLSVGIGARSLDRFEINDA